MTRNPLRSLPWFVLLVFLGCGVDDAVIEEAALDTAESDSALKSYPGLVEDSMDALGVLRLANEGTLALLASEREVNLPARTARSMIAIRSGPDGVAGTPDDRPFRTLSELYAVRYVGTVSVRNLLTYARAHGYVPKRYQLTVQAKNGEDWPNHPAPRTTYTFELRVESLQVHVSGTTTQGYLSETLPLTIDANGQGTFSRGSSQTWPTRLQVAGRVQPSGVDSFWLLDARYAPGSQGYDYFWMSYAFRSDPLP